MSSAAKVNAVDRFLTRHIDAGRAGQRALVAGEVTLTYGALHEREQRAAGALRELGVTRGDRVVIVLPDSPTAVAFLLGAIALGAAPAAIPVGMREAEHAFLCGDCEPRVAVVEAGHAQRMARIRAASGWPREVLLATADDALARAERVEPVPVEPQEMALLQYTSGSTGRPKGVVHLHRGLLALPDGFGARLALRETDLCYSTAKLSFGYGMGNSVFFPLAAGATVLLRAAPSDPLGVLATIDAAKPTVVFSGPTLYGAIAAIRGAERAFDLSSVRLYVSAGDVLSAALFRRWRERFGREILDGLGSTECLHVFIAGRAGALRAGRVGEVVAPYRVRLLDDDGRAVGPGVAGHLEVSGPSNGARYWNRAHETRTTMAGGWVRTGDMLEWDRDAGFRYLGRSDDVFKVRELKVSPVEVEELLNAHPGVAESAVVGRADSNGLTEVCAFVRPARGRAPGRELARELRADLRERLAPHKLPRAFEFVEALPRTSSGKLARHALRAKRSAGLPDLRPLDVDSLISAAAAETAPAELAEPLRLVLRSRGKGIRPAVVFEAARCGRDADSESVQVAAHAVELLHVATITHDDVIDHGELRRGVPTIAAERGSHMAVTVGVWLLGRVAELLIDCGPGILAHASGAIAQMCDGQLLEARDLFDPDRTVADYLQAIAGKTAALFALSAWLGATLAGAPSPQVDALQRYGHELGIAYQIADDLNDLLGADPTKHAGSDLREGVYTLPVIYAIGAEPRLRELLTPTLTTTDVERVIQTAQDTGALARTRRHCHDHARTAEDALHGIPTPQPLLQELTQAIRAMCDG